MSIKRRMTRSEFADFCGVTSSMIAYYLRRGVLKENDDRMIDTRSTGAKELIDHYARALKNQGGAKPIVPGKRAKPGRKVMRSQEELDALKPRIPNKPEKDDHVDRDCAALALQYAKDIVSGKVDHGTLARMACERHMKDLKRAGTPGFPYVFDPKLANRACNFIERLPHIKGKWAKDKQLLVLGAWQCFIVSSIFGWIHKDTKLRRFNEVYWAVPRKNAKSTTAAAIGDYMLLADGEHGAEVYAGATTEKQAWEVFGPARLMVKNTPSIVSEFGVQVWAKALVKADDLSKFWPIIGNPGDGSSPSCAIIDEYHEHNDSNMLDTMVTGMGAREQPLCLIITTAGTNLASPCYDKQKEAEKVLMGIFENENLFAIIYAPDEKDAKNWADPAILRKCNPNMGVSVSEEYLLARQREAVQNPSYQTRFKTKHLNIWCQASVAGINMDHWRKCADPSLTEERFAGDECIESLDLASKIDVCDKVKLFTKMVGSQRHYYAFARHYLPERTIEDTHVNKNAYEKWMLDGKIVATPGAEIDFDIIREDVKADSLQHHIKEVVYDPWRATQLAQQLAKDGATVVEMAQNAKNMGEAFDEFTSALKTGRFHHNGDEVLEWMASNVVAKEVTKGLVVPSKDTKDAKIDGIVAIVMAISRSLASEPGGGLMDWMREAVTA